MHVGMMTAPFKNEPMDTVLEFADSAGIPCLEILVNPGCKHFNLATFDRGKARALLQAVDARGLRISALAYYDPTITQPKFTRSVQATMKRTIDAAALLGLDTVCLLAGFPAEGKSKLETIETVLPGLFKPVLNHAKKKNVRIALENWYRTCLQGLDTFEAMFRSIPDDRFGLNYDPSHLYHQECDHLLPVTLYRDRIFHSHAKDTLIDRANRARCGILAEGWWRYVIPGFGNINWGEYISHLRQNGYDGVLSIEHEDKTQSREDGFKRGAWFLEQFC